jgi:ABC-2 type transport system permease protein
VPFTAMFNGLNVIVDRQFGITRELLVAPVARSIIPLANAAAVTTITLFQTALIVVLAIARGANFTMRWTTPLWVIPGVVLLTWAIYGIAETLALKVNRQETYGPLIAAVGVAPWFVSGTLFPLTALVPVTQYVSRLLPWTHAVSVFRYALMDARASGLSNIWGFGSPATKAAMSMAYLAGFAALSLVLAARTFRRATQL